MILHVDMDAFFASIEQAINPRLKNKPLIVGARNSKFHTVVCAASYEAKACGIGSGMSSKEAFSICPGLEFVAADQSKYIWTSGQIFKLLEGYNFKVFYASIDEFQMDIGAYLDPAALALDIQNKIASKFNITASIGIAKNCLLAKLGSKLNKPRGIAIITEDSLKEMLGRTPAKRLCGVGKSTEQLLSGLGIETCLDLYEKTPAYLEKALGKYGINLYVSLHSTDTFEHLDQQAAQGPKSISHSYTLPRACQTPRFIKAWIRLLSEMVARRLRQEKLLGSTTHLWLNGPEIGNFNAQEASGQPTDDGFEIYSRALKIIVKLGKNMPLIRALGVSCTSLSQAKYPPLFREQKKREDLIKAMDAINSRYGEDSIYPAIIAFAQKMD